MEKITLDDEFVPVNQFDNLLNLITKGQTSWIELPELAICVGDESIPTRIFAFNPEELPGDYESRYSPSIYIELGARDYQDDGKSIGEVLKFGVKRSQLEINGKATEELRQKAEQELELLKEIYFAYQNGSPRVVV